MWPCDGTGLIFSGNDATENCTHKVFFCSFQYCGKVLDKTSTLLWAFCRLLQVDGSP